VVLDTIRARLFTVMVIDSNDEIVGDFLLVINMTFLVIEHA